MLGRTEGPKSRPSESCDFHSLLPHIGRWAAGQGLEALSLAGRVPWSLSLPQSVQSSVPLCSSCSLMHSGVTLRLGCLLFLETKLEGLWSKWEPAQYKSVKLPVASSGSQYTKGNFYSESSPASFRSEWRWGSGLVSWACEWMPEKQQLNSTTAFIKASHKRLAHMHKPQCRNTRKIRTQGNMAPPKLNNSM
jgi:hypothetical protein